ncbi:MAG: tetratricopeptide repeat protein [Bacteroidia bacterium]
MRAVILILFIFFGGTARAQLNYPEVDSLSYTYYLQKDWKALIRLADEAGKQEMNFYYLNIRAGIAAYELGRWTLAEKYFLEALIDNPGGTLSPEYLYKIYALNGMKSEAAKMIELLPDSIQRRLDFKRRKMFESLYLESGQRFSDNPDSVRNSYYYQLSSNHKLSPRFKLGQSLTFLQQDFQWTKFEQLQYTLTPVYYIGKSLEVSTAVSYIDFKRDLNLNYQSKSSVDHREFPTPNGPIIIDSSIVVNTSLLGNTKVQSLNLHFNLSYRWKEISLSAQAVYFTEKYMPFYDSVSSVIYRTEIGRPDGSFNTIDFETIDSRKITTAEIENTHQSGLSLDYTYRFSKNSWLRPGAEFHWVFRDAKSDFVWVPYMEFILLDKFSLLGYYLQKDFHPVSIFNGTHVFNNYDKINHRLSVTAGFGISPSVGISLTYQHDKITDSFTGYKYIYNSGYIGINIKL